MIELDSFDKQNPRFMDYVYLLYKRWILIIALTGGALSIGYVATFIVPKFYASEVLFVSQAKTQSQTTGRMNAEAAMISTALAAAVGTSSDGNAFYISLVETRRVQDGIIDSLHLMDYYKVDERDGARGLLKKYTQISEGKGGFVKLRVLDRSAEMAQRIAAAYAREINNFLQSLSVAENEKYANFLEDRIKVAAKELERTSLEREAAVKEALYVALLKEYELARANAAKERIDIQVVDDAETNPYPVAPNRRLYMIVSAALGFLLSLFAILAEQWWRSLIADSRNAFLVRKIFARRR